jgi:hypothetical protein
MLMLAAALTAAAPQEPVRAPEAAPPKPAAEKLICKSRLKTGSRTAFVETCLTAADWGMIKRENRSVVERGQQQQNRFDPNEAKPGNQGRQ